MKKSPLIKSWLQIKTLRNKISYKTKNSFSMWKWFKRLVILGVILVGMIFSWLFFIFIPSLPDVLDVENLVAAQASEIYDRNGGLLYTIHGDENRKDVSIDVVSSYAIQAILAIEDDAFYEHMGIDLPAILKAVCAELKVCPKARGGSTITQQFIKNAVLTPERSYKRKLAEVVLAFRLEANFSKDKILEMYLNRIPYGSNVYGIERAANVFFDKPASELTLPEAAVLAAIPNAPTYYSPYGNNKFTTITANPKELFEMNIETEKDLLALDPDFVTWGLLGKTYTYSADQETFAEVGSDVNEAEGIESEENKEEVRTKQIYVRGRVNVVFDRMKALGFIDQAEYDQAIKDAELLVFNKFREEIRAPHFVMFVRQYLEDTYGKDQIEKGGLKVITTIDPDLQKVAEEVITENAERNLTRYEASNASLVSMDPNNGQILAMVGSVDYWNDDIDGKVNVALRPRLPGSSFKPVAYAAAFLQGYAPSTVVYDVKTRFGSTYSPENFDGQFRGPVSFKDALASSLNIPAIKAAHLAGVPNVLDLARKMGIQLNQPDDWYGLSLALGAGEARLLDMVQAYTIFSNGGYKMDPISILKIQDRNGNILEEYQSPQNKNLVLDPQVAYLVNKTLSDVNARPAGYWRDTLSIPGQVNAAKTGTSNKKINNVNYPFDTWTIGYTRHISTGVWVGNSDGKHLNLRATGLDTAGKIWRGFMTKATEGKPKESFERPEGIRFVKISDKTGKLPTENTPADAIVTAEFASFSVPTDRDDTYQKIKIDKVSGKLATEFTPDAAIEERVFFEHRSILPNNTQWQSAVEKWAKNNDQNDKIPTEYDDVHTAETVTEKPVIRILSPSSNSTVAPPTIGVTVDTQATAGVKKVEYYWDDLLLSTAENPPYSATLRLPRATEIGGQHVLKAVIYDKLLHTNQSSVKLKIGQDTAPPILSFVSPDSGVTVSPGASLPIQVEATDNNGSVLKVLFYLDGELKKTVRDYPFVWSFVAPEKLGRYTIKAVAVDHAKNETEKTIDIEVEKGSENTSFDESVILSPGRNSAFKITDVIQVSVALSDSARPKLKELILLARSRSGGTVEVSRIVNNLPLASQKHQFIWSNPPEGVYDLLLRTEFTDGSSETSSRVPILVQSN